MMRMSVYIEHLDFKGPKSSWVSHFLIFHSALQCDNLAKLITPPQLPPEWTDLQLCLHPGDAQHQCAEVTFRLWHWKTTQDFIKTAGDLEAKRYKMNLESFILSI